MTNSFRSTAGTIYAYFILYGMAVIMLAQNADHLQEQWGTTEGNVLFAISGIGIGKIIGPAFAGLLSDRFGRRFNLLISQGAFILFFVGVLLSPSWQVGFALAVWFGLSNAMLDTGAYPTLMESFPTAAGSANLIVKASIAAGQFLLPLIINALAGGGVYWGWTFLGSAILLSLVTVVTTRLSFPDHRAIAEAQKARIVALTDQAGAKIGVEGAALVLYGFTSVSVFWLAQTSLPKIGMNLAGMSEAAGRGLVSVYSIGSLIGVLATAALVARKFRPVSFLVLNPTVAALAYVGILVTKNAALFPVFAFLIGYFAAGGLFQLTVVVLAEFFPVRKGLTTSLIGLASGLAAFALPYISGVIVGDATDPVASYSKVVVVGIVVAVASAALGSLVIVRHRAVFPRTVAAPELATAVAAG